MPKVEPVKVEREKRIKWKNLFSIKKHVFSAFRVSDLVSADDIGPD